MEHSATRSCADWLAEGDAYYDAQRWNEAGLAFEHALALDPRQARAWFRLGNVREEQGRDEAAADCFEKAIAVDPAHAQAWNNLGGARQRLGRDELAIEAYRKAIAADPKLAQPYLNLGRLAAGRGEHALAAECVRKGLEQHPGDPTFEHLLAAATGSNTPQAPEGYVTALFDGIAPQFERHLLHDLEYGVPEALARLVGPKLAALRGAGRQTAAPVCVIDLGCGTGLVGAALAATGAQVIGIDLSPRMLQLAARRGVYARLEQGDLVEVLRRMATGSARAVLAADVFIYVGDLETVFAAVSRVLAPGGVFAFSVEALEGEDYRLQPTGRYAQSPDYLRALAGRVGLEECSFESARIRRDGRGYAEGWLALFGKPA